MVEISGEYDEENYANKVSIVISIVTFDSHILAFEFIFAINICDRLAFFLSSFLDRWLKFYRHIWVTDSIQYRKSNGFVTYFFQNVAGLEQTYISIWLSQHNNRFFAGAKLR